MARITSLRRRGRGAMNLDIKGRINSFLKPRHKQSIRNQFRRKSNGGMGG